MNAASFRLYDSLHCAAAAVEESAAGRIAAAETAWLEALLCASGLFPAGSDLQRALGVIVEAARPAASGPARALLRNALDAASWAVLAAMTGDAAGTSIRLRDVHAAIALLPGDTGFGFAVVAGEIRAAALEAAR